MTVAVAGETGVAAAVTQIIACLIAFKGAPEMAEDCSLAKNVSAVFGKWVLLVNEKKYIQWI